LVYAVDGVVDEIKDANTRASLQILPYEFKLKNPTSDAVKFGKFRRICIDYFKEINFFCAVSVKFRQENRRLFESLCGRFASRCFNLSVVQRKYAGRRVRQTQIRTVQKFCNSTFLSY